MCFCCGEARVRGWLRLFQRGGQLSMAGRGARTAMPPVVARMDFPLDWRVIVVLDREPKASTAATNKPPSQT